MLVAAKELAEILGMNVQVVLLKAREGKFPCYRMDKILRFDTEEILRLMRKEMKNSPY